MQESENTQLVPPNLPFESLKKLNEHAVEYWSARDLQPFLGYSEWRKFENTIKKAITTCKQSGNDPSHHFAGAGKMVVVGSGADRAIDEGGGLRDHRDDSDPRGKDRPAPGG